MFLSEMKGASQIEWGTPMFDGANNARAKVTGRDGDVTVEFDERGDGVEMMVSGDNVNFDALDGISQAVREYRDKHPGVKIKLQPHDNASKFVGRYLQGILD